MRPFLAIAFLIAAALSPAVLGQDADYDDYDNPSLQDSDDDGSELPFTIEDDIQLGGASNAVRDERVGSEVTLLPDDHFSEYGVSQKQAYNLRTLLGIEEIYRHIATLYKGLQPHAFDCRLKRGYGYPTRFQEDDESEWNDAPIAKYTQCMMTMDYQDDLEKKGVFTAEVSGTYLFTFTAYMYAKDGGKIILGMYKNEDDLLATNALRHHGVQHTYDHDRTTQTMTATTNLKKGDTVEVKFIRLTDGKARITTTAFGASTHFTGAKLGYTYGEEYQFDSTSFPKETLEVLEFDGSRSVSTPRITFFEELVATQSKRQPQYSKVRW